MSRYSCYGHFGISIAKCRYEGAVLSWFHFMLILILFQSDSSNIWLCNVVITFLTYALLWQKEATCFEVNEVTEIVQTVVGSMTLGCRGTSLFQDCDGAAEMHEPCSEVVGPLGWCFPLGCANMRRLLHAILNARGNGQGRLHCLSHQKWDILE